MSKIRNVAIIGAGIGSAHADGYAKLPDRFQIHTICDIAKEKAEPIVDKHNALFVADYEEVLLNSEIDVIDICLPPNLHFDAIVKALKADKDVICEKPVVTSVSEVDQLIEISTRIGRPVFPVFFSIDMVKQSNKYWH